MLLLFLLLSIFKTDSNDCALCCFFITCIKQLQKWMCCLIHLLFNELHENTRERTICFARLMRFVPQRQKWLWFVYTFSWFGYHPAQTVGAGSSPSSLSLMGSKSFKQQKRHSHLCRFSMDISKKRRNTSVISEFVNWK